MKNKQNSVVCPDCCAPLKFDPKTLSVGDILECQNCGTESEVISLEPIKLQIVEEEK